MLLMVISHAKIPYAQTDHTPSPSKLGISMAFFYWELDKKRNLIFKKNRVNLEVFSYEK
jgi:hypothetical protein